MALNLQTRKAGGNKDVGLETKMWKKKMRYLLRRIVYVTSTF